MNAARRWVPAAILGLTALTTGFRSQPDTPELQRDLRDALPRDIGDFSGADQRLSPEAIEAADVSDYLARLFTGPDGTWFSLYVGYHDRQLRGRTLHSPKNCLPGAGWQALTTSFETIETRVGPATIVRALVQKGDERVVVLYWYQGRGRVQSSEYLVKWDLLRDAVRTGRTDEAVVRIVTPVRPSEEQAFQVAAAAARRVIPALFEALP